MDMSFLDMYLISAIKLCRCTIDFKLRTESDRNDNN